ncbi:MAG: ligase-associated DNA damage response endonuclease PdeM [Elainellaceae cyanobacterium]
MSNIVNIEILNTTLRLLPEKAIYIEPIKSLLVSDVHLGKSETFQSFGIPISNRVNHTILRRLRQLCLTIQPDHLFILGDLFHSKFALSDEGIDGWLRFLNDANVEAHLILGNHDRHLSDTLKQLSIECLPTAIQIDNLILSHEPQSSPGCLNICGHTHPCLRIKTTLDDLRLPCFYFEKTEPRLTLPSFGDFTGGYEIRLTRHSSAYVVVDDQIVPFGD